MISTAVIPVLTRRAAALSFLTAGTFDGQAAEAWGLITMSVPATEIDDAVANVTSNISACSRQGLEHSKRLLTIDALMRIDDLGDDLADLSSELFGSDEAKARMKALLAG